MKFFVLVAFAIVIARSPLHAQVVANGSVSSPHLLGSIWWDNYAENFTRDGSATAGFAWSEATLWHSDSSFDVLGNVYTNPDTQALDEESVYYATYGGTAWVQYRVVDVNYDYEDQWIPIDVGVFMDLTVQREGSDAPWFKAYCNPVADSISSFSLTFYNTSVGSRNYPTSTGDGYGGYSIDDIQAVNVSGGLSDYGSMTLTAIGGSGTTYTLVLSFDYVLGGSSNDWTQYFGFTSSTAD